MPPDKLPRSDVCSLSAVQDGQQLRVAGWIRSARISKNVIFVALSDGSTADTLQVVIVRNAGHWEELIPDLLTGASIEVIGALVATPSASQPFELAAQRLMVIGRAPATDYPLQKKEHSWEFLRNIAHLRLRSTTHGALMRLRSWLSGAIRHFFEQRNFIEIHTPIISSHDAEGAGALFEVRAPQRDAAHHHFFGAPAFLTVSGQLHAECAACALGRVYSFGPTFRAENSHTIRHLSEFWMVEPEMAWYTLDDNRRLAEELVANLAGQALEHQAKELHLLERHSAGLCAKIEGLTKLPYRVIEYSEAIKQLKQAQIAFEYPPRWGLDLQSEHEQWLVAHCSKGAPLFVVNYPQEIKPFYMRLNDDGITVAAMDLLLAEVGEIIGGSQREERLDYLLQRMQRDAMEQAAYQWYIELRKYGTVPHSGFGLGLDRLLLYLSGMHNVRDVVPFPRAPGQAVC